MSMPMLDIVVVNWNSGDLLRSGLASIKASKRDGFLLSKVVLVDNASTDMSLEGLDGLGLPLHIIRNRANLGFAAACNQGARAGDGDYVLFFNPDARLTEDTLSRTIAFMERPERARIGICGVRLTEDDGTMSVSCARFPTLRIFLGKATGLSRLFPGVFPEHFMRSSELQNSGEVDQVIGAFFMVRRSIYDFLNGFDERFFVYFEEVDFSLRAKQMGYSSYYLSDVSAYHRCGGTSEQIKAQRLFYSLRSRIQYAFKHFSTPSALLLVLFTCTVELAARILSSMAKGSMTQTVDTINGYKKLFHYLLRA